MSSGIVVAVYEVNDLGRPPRIKDALDKLITIRTRNRGNTA